MKKQTISFWAVAAVMAAIVLAGWVWIPAVTAQNDSFYAANWNIENLFDTVDDPHNDGDDEFLPRNPWTRWTERRLKEKMDHLAEVVRTMNNGQGPDLLGLEEVENREVVGRFAALFKNKRYGIAYSESRDYRGIDVALLYNQDLFTLVRVDDIRVTLRGATTRDILHAELKDIGGRTLHVLVNHWPSRGGGIAKTRPFRYEAARALAGAVADIFRQNQEAMVMVMGDFNDEPHSSSVAQILRAKTFSTRAELEPMALYNISAKTAKQGGGSHVFFMDGAQEWKMYDQFFVSGTLLSGRGAVTCLHDSFEVIQPPCMTIPSGRNRGAPLPSFVGGDHYMGGYSDHFPVGARFILN